MLFTFVLAVLGPVLIFAAIMLLNSGAHLRPDVSGDELGRTLGGAFAMWFGVMFFVGFIAFVSGLPKKFTVAFSGGRDAFRERMDAAARSVRYRPRDAEGHRLVYKPPFYSFLAERITADIGETTAEVSAPAGLRKKLEKRLAPGA